VALGKNLSAVVVRLVLARLDPVTSPVTQTD
jgi:hypothetical protein